jgi:propanediol dehydratase large subunit
LLGILTSPWNIGLTIINKVDRNIILFSSDNDPPQGFKIKKGYVVTLSKTLSSKQKILFRAIEDPSRAKVLLNSKESMEVTATQGKPSPVPVTLTGKSLRCTVDWRD